MKILVSNDDGIYAPGIAALFNELKKIGSVTAVAPLEEKSTTGHSLTLHKPLRIHAIRKNFYGVSGSPADCIYVGIREILKGEPDLVVSGINRGANLGQDIYYSGTVSAAREASILGIPSIAVSLVINYKKNPAEDDMHYADAAKVVRNLIKKHQLHKLPYHTLLNINVPDLKQSKIKGFKYCRQGFRKYGGPIIKRKDHRGREYYWVGGQYLGFKDEPGTDCYWSSREWATITPVQLDATDGKFLKQLESKIK